MYILIFVFNIYKIYWSIASLPFHLDPGLIIEKKEAPSWDIVIYRSFNRINTTRKIMYADLCEKT